MAEKKAARKAASSTGTAAEQETVASAGPPEADGAPTAQAEAEAIGLAEKASALAVRPDESPWSKEELEPVYVGLREEADRLRAEVEAAEARLSGTGLETTGIDDTICCYATKVETWVVDPDGARWEWYVKTGDSEQLVNETLGSDTATCCAGPADEPVAVGAATACCG